MLRTPPPPLIPSSGPDKTPTGHSPTVSHPFPASPSQSLNPSKHPPVAHAFDEHPGNPLGVAHACPHSPQFSGSWATSVSQPRQRALTVSIVAGAAGDGADPMLAARVGVRQDAGGAGVGIVAAAPRDRRRPRSAARWDRPSGPPGTAGSPADRGRRAARTRRRAGTRPRPRVRHEARSKRPPDPDASVSSEVGSTTRNQTIPAETSATPSATSASSSLVSIASTSACAQNGAHVRCRSWRWTRAQMPRDADVASAAAPTLPTT